MRLLLFLVFTVISADPHIVLSGHLYSGQEIVIDLKTSGCRGHENEINFLEHVELLLDMEYSKRGDLAIFLISPSNTDTMLLSERPNDKSAFGFQNWTFMSVHNWGETPDGTWQLKIRDHAGKGNSGMIKSVNLVLHGTRESPPHVKKAGGRRIYNNNYNDVIESRMSETMIRELDKDIAKLRDMLVRNR